MRVLCDKCGKELEEDGALIISPPLVVKLEYNTVAKMNICTHCWGWLWDWLQGDYDK